LYKPCRYISLATDSARGKLGLVVITNGPVCVRESEVYRDG
jgi:hypothetical protein